MEQSALVISGAGLVGLSAALLYANRFEAVHVLEKREIPEHHQSREARSLQLVLSARGWRTLKKLGLEQTIRQNSLSLRGRTRHSGGKSFFEPYAVTGEKISCVSRNTLHRLLSDHAKAHAKISVHYNEAVSGLLLDEKVVVTTKNGKETPWRYDFLLGADGVGSQVAQAFNSETERIRKIEANQYREIKLNETPWENDTFHYWHNEYAMIGAFPVYEGGFSVFLVHLAEDTEKLLTDSSPDWFNSLFPGFLADVPDARERFSASKGGILGSIDCLHWHYSNHSLIVGDAAHAMLPFMGQGLNTGLEDLFELDPYLGPGGKIPVELLQLFISNRKAQASAIRDISKQQFQYLTGKFTSRDYALKHLLDDFLRKENMPDTYMACAFSLEPFADIRKRELQLKASFTDEQINQRMALDSLSHH